MTYLDHEVLVAKRNINLLFINLMEKMHAILHASLISVWFSASQQTNIPNIMNVGTVDASPLAIHISLGSIPCTVVYR